jgi:hypothetical protein
MRIRRPSNAYCAHSPVLICSRWSQTGASGTRLLVRFFEAIILSRNVKVFSFCLRHFFGVRWENYTIPFEAASLPSRESSGRNSSGTSPITRKSVVFSEEGERRAQELFERHFGRKG